MEAKIQSVLSNAKVTPNGAKFVAKALHPASGKWTGIPDAQTMPCVVLQDTAVAAISVPDNVTEGELWDCLLIKPPCDNLGAVVVTGPSGTRFDEPLGSYPANVDRRFLTLETLADNAQGYERVPTISQPTPPDLPIAAQRAVASLPAAWRMAASSITVYNNSSALVDGGTVTAAQFTRKARHDIGVVSTSAVPEGTPNYFAEQLVLDLPLNEESIAQLAPKGLYVGPAREGAYMPLKLAGPVQEMVGDAAILTTCDGKDNTDGYTGMYSARQTGATGIPANYWVVANGGGRSSYTLPYRQTGTYNPDFSCLSSGVDQHVNWGVVIFRSLPYEAALEVKVINVREVVPSRDSPWRRFVEPAEQFDEKAMRLYYQCAADMEQAYPARYNSLAMLLPIIKSALAKLVMAGAPYALDAVVAKAKEVRKNAKQQIAERKALKPK
jgi:hypothetical protein